MSEAGHLSRLILKDSRTPERLPSFTFHFLLLQDPADQCVLLEREGSRKLQCVPGFSMLPGPGPQPGSSPHLRAALQRVPRAGEGEQRRQGTANRGSRRFGATVLTSLSTDSLRPQWAAAGTYFIIHYLQRKTPKLFQGSKGALPLQTWGWWRNGQLGKLVWQQIASVRTGMMDGEGILSTSCPLGWGWVCGRPALPAHAALVESQVCYHHGNNADPEERDCPTAFADIQDVHILSRFVRDLLPDLEPEPAIMEHCMYTVRVWAAGPGPAAALESRGTRQMGRPDSTRPLTGCDLKQKSSFLQVGSPPPERAH